MTGAMHPIRVLAFDQYAYMGGGQRMLLESLASLHAAGHDVTLAAPKGGALEAAVLAEFGTAVRHLECRTPELTHGKKGFRDALRFLGLLVHFVRAYRSEALRADLIYVNGPRWFLGGSILSRLTGRPAVFHLHLEHKGAQVKALRACARISKKAAYIANSCYVARKTYGQLGMLPAEDLKVVENCLSSGFTSLAFEDRFSRVHAPLQVVVLGVLRQEKGQDLAVELARRCPGVVVHLVGRIGCGAEDWVKELLADKPSNVVVHGEVSDIPRFLSEHGIHVNLVPSVWEEPFGLVAIEGMAGSCVTVVSDKGSLGDIARHTGAHVFDGEIDDLLRVFEDLQRLPVQALSDMAKRQHECVMREYSAVRYQKAFSAAIDEVMR